MENLPESVSLCCVYLLGQDEAVAAECEHGCAQVCSLCCDLWWGHSLIVSPLASALSPTMKHMLRVCDLKDTVKAWALSCPQDYEPPRAKDQNSSGDPLKCCVHKIGHVTFPSIHLIVASNDAVVKLPWALPVALLLWWFLLLLLSSVFYRNLRGPLWFPVDLSGAHPQLR